MKSVDRVLDQFQAKAQEKLGKNERLKQLRDMRVLLMKPEGRRMFYRLLARTHCFSTVFDADPAMLAHNSGWQDAGFFLSAELQEASLEHYFLMLKEGLSDEQQAAVTMLVEAQTMRSEAESSGEDVDS